MKVPHTISATSISIFTGDKLYTIDAGDLRFKALSEYLKEKDNHDEDELAELLDTQKAITSLSVGRVTVEDDEVLFDGEPMHGSLTMKLLYLLREGFDAKPWANFLNNLMDNPSYNSRKCLYNFLDHFNTPITEDGCFLTFKRVREDYMDIHSNSMYNGVGTVVKMDRQAVDDNPKNTCSSGLHVCASEYLEGFASWTNHRTVLCKVNPRDVVAVPGDYNFSKMRVCQYEVVSEVTSKEQVKEIETKAYYDDYVDDSWDYYDDFE